jgi:hypothetical protein
MGSDDRNKKLGRLNTCIGWTDGWTEIRPSDRWHDGVRRPDRSPVGRLGPMMSRHTASRRQGKRTRTERLPARPHIHALIGVRAHARCLRACVWVRACLHACARVCARTMAGTHTLAFISLVTKVHLGRRPPATGTSPMHAARTRARAPTHTHFSRAHALGREEKERRVGEGGGTCSRARSAASACSTPSPFTPELKQWREEGG